MTNTNYKQDIRTFLENFISEEDFADEDDIFELGLVSSLMAMQLVLFVEKTLDIRVESEDLNLDNFRSIDRMDTFMQKVSAPVHG
ncbi:phosphopantetheine-binding protein [Pseudohongiella sp.]|uniref:Carrier domain-containing protein n=1 Tax=marine sediment metagenome TaxID=412755 RepID=A0A0F9W6C4_9ZZZZ|nr:phosphopantetheine-binding protein [Pseudohongiella sp.]